MSDRSFEQLLQALDQAEEDALNYGTGFVMVIHDEGGVLRYERVSPRHVFLDHPDLVDELIAERGPEFGEKVESELEQRRLAREDAVNAAKHGASSDG